MFPLPAFYCDIYILRNSRGHRNVANYGRPLTWLTTNRGRAPLETVAVIAPLVGDFFWGGGLLPAACCKRYSSCVVVRFVWLFIYLLFFISYILHPNYLASSQETRSWFFSLLLLLLLLSSLKCARHRSVGNPTANELHLGPFVEGGASSLSTVASTTPFLQPSSGV